MFRDDKKKGSQFTIENSLSRCINWGFSKNLEKVTGLYFINDRGIPMHCKEQGDGRTKNCLSKKTVIKSNAPLDNLGSSRIIYSGNRHVPSTYVKETFWPTWFARTK